MLEDLRNYQPPKHRRKLSRKLSNWLRGAVYELLKYKAQRCGIKLVRVNPRWTSSYCPRCGAKGAKISEPRARQVLKTGKFFYCGACSYLADRDYIAAVNIYRVYHEKRKKRFSLKQAKPVPYTATGIPLNRPELLLILVYNERNGYGSAIALIIIGVILNIVGRLLTPVIGSFLNFIGLILIIIGVILLIVRARG